jgi:hypothetical protein
MGQCPRSGRAYRRRRPGLGQRNCLTGHRASFSFQSWSQSHLIGSHAGGRRGNLPGDCLLRRHNPTQIHAARRYAQHPGDAAHVLTGGSSACGAEVEGSAAASDGDSSGGTSVGATAGSAVGIATSWISGGGVAFLGLAFLNHKPNCRALIHARILRKDFDGEPAHVPLAEWARKHHWIEPGTHEPLSEYHYAEQAAGIPPSAPAANVFWACSQH